MKRTGHLVSLGPSREAELLQWAWSSALLSLLCTYTLRGSIFVDQAHGILLCATVFGKILVEPLYSHR